MHDDTVAIMHLSHEPIVKSPVQRREVNTFRDLASRDDRTEVNNPDEIKKKFFFRHSRSQEGALYTKIIAFSSSREAAYITEPLRSHRDYKREILAHATRGEK